MREQLLAYVIKYGGEYLKIKKAIKDNEDWVPTSSNYNYITILDKEYPAKLLRLPNPPFVLFYIGDLSLLKEDGVAIVGTRCPSLAGNKAIKAVMDNINSSYSIISGLAKGIDGLAHSYGLNHHKCIGVIGCGINVIYPKVNGSLYGALKEKHLIVSEYPEGIEPLAFHFPMRNRIIVALSNNLIVIEAKLHSGTMLSVNEALNINVPVYCIPHDIFNEMGLGCNELIKQGANMIVNIEDIKDI
ncbi:MAG: DNA-processing protein DprA [Erysipelotrichaceae bacterium]